MPYASSSTDLACTSAAMSCQTRWDTHRLRELHQTSGAAWKSVFIWTVESAFSVLGDSSRMQFEWLSGEAGAALQQYVTPPWRVRLPGCQLQCLTARDGGLLPHWMFIHTTHSSLSGLTPQQTSALVRRSLELEGAIANSGVRTAAVLDIALLCISPAQKHHILLKEISRLNCGL